VALNSGSCDIVASGITITPEREEKIDFSEPYFDANQGLLVAEGSGLDDVDSLAGKKVGVQQATTGETWANDNGLDVVQFEDLGLQVQALKTGQIDAAVNDIAVLGAYVGDGLEVAAEFSTGEQYGLGVKKGNTALLDQVNATLDRIREDGTYDTLYTKFIGTAPADAASADPSPSDG
jgi:polar amino acid transport system substrate-binding protein